MSEVRIGQQWRHRRKGHTVTITSLPSRLGFIRRRLPGEMFLRERIFRKRYELVGEG